MGSNIGLVDILLFIFDACGIVRIYSDAYLMPSASVDFFNTFAF